MSLFGFFRRSRAGAGTADMAKERLQILLAHERQDRAGPDYLPKLRNDILDVIRKHVPGAGEKVVVKMQRGGGISTLGIEIELPPPQPPKSRTAGRATTPAFAR